MTDVEINVYRLRHVDDVVPAARALSARRGSQSIHLRLDELSTESRIDPVAGSLLAWILCTRARRPDLHVVAPRNEGLLRQLARVGFWFALAQRPGPTTLAGAPAGEGRLFEFPPEWTKLEPWQGHWQPSERDFRSRALGAPSNEPPSPWEVIQHEFIAFKNPHLGVERSRLASEVNDNVVMHWIRRLVGEEGARRDTGSDALLAATGTTVRELIYNFAVHPFSTLTTAPPQHRDVPKDRQIGYVALYVTRGGGDQSFDRLHIVVSDCGHGIPATLRPKLPRSVNAETRDADDELVRRMLKGQLPNYGRAEGRGFIRLVDLADRHNGTLVVVTAAQDGVSGTLVATVQQRDGVTHVDVEALGQLDVDGTIVRMMLPLVADEASSPAGRVGPP